jgi:hypothetical protein
MKKLLRWYDTYVLKILVSFLILFTALYPKLPSIHIMRTWVYIRLEDFFILAVVIIWFIQLLRRKVYIPKVFLAAIGTYWFVGLLSLLYSILVIGPTLTNFFPHVAALSYIRRIEYMILFFVAFSSVRTKKDIRDYFIILAATIGLISLYGIGQRYYVALWAFFPNLFQGNPFCFPSFQTGNEEFAKGIPLCLPPGGRTTSTFGGSYDLGAYLVMVLPVVIGVFVAIKRWWLKLLTFLVYVSGLMLLIFTAQRAAFVAYLAGGIFTLILYRKKLFIIPLIIISIISLSVFSEATAKRFLSTFRISSVVTNSEGELIGEALPKELKSKFQKPKGGEYLPEGSAFIGLPQEKTVVAKEAMVKKTLTPQEARRLQLAEGTLQISKIEGSFLVRKVLVYDISFTTRFQAEWPNAIRAFERSPILGSGYSTITLATDNDYLRALGETGVLGLLSFSGIFLILWITLRKYLNTSMPSVMAGFVFGLAGGVLGLMLNAILIDVFEASKVAENLWMLLGIGVGGLYSCKKIPISYFSELKKIFTSSRAYAFYIFAIILAAFSSGIANFFVADDFTWLKWAATDSIQNLPNHFINAQNFFYRPLIKTITFFLYTLFSFQPGGYHLFMLLLHFLATLSVYLLSKKILKDKFLAFSTSVLFALHPVHAENILWFSGLSGVLATVFIMYATLNFMRFREKKTSVLSYVLAIVLTVGAFMSYEIAVVTPLIFIIIDLFIFHTRVSRKALLPHIPFLVLVPAYYLLRIATNTFQGGGDYSYNLIKLIPNSVGNFFGYIGLFMFNESFLSFYNLLRDNLRENTVMFIGVFTLVLIMVGVLKYKYRTSIVALLKRTQIALVIFGIVFAFVSLIPFLGLGNIAQRYLYLGSFGLCLSLVVLLKQAAGLIFPRSIRKSTIIVFVFVVIIASWYQLENTRQIKNWGRAGFLTSDTLAFFRVEHENLSASDNVYIVERPIKHNNAWVFPVGMEDGMWFIYRDNMPSVKHFGSVEEAKTEAAIQNKRTFIFKYDKNGNISRVK